MIRVLIADDHPIIRKGLSEILAEAPDVVVSGEAGNGREALRQAGEGTCDLVLLDISMPDKHGLDVLAEMKDRKPALPVLILSMYPEEQYALRALKAGASGYLVKDSAPEELVAAIRKAAAGGVYVSPALAERLAVRLGGTFSGPPHEALSQREFQVLCLIAQGQTVGEIAVALFLSPKTVSTYRRRILTKMDLSNNAELMRYAMENRLV